MERAVSGIPNSVRAITIASGGSATDQGSHEPPTVGQVGTPKASSDPGTPSVQSSGVT